MRRLSGVLPLVLVAAVSAGIVGVLLPLTPSFDLDVFLRAGDALRHGREVYPSPNSAAVYSGHSFVYPLVSALPFVPLAALPHALARAIFLGVSALAILLAAGGRSDGDRWPAVLLLATAFTITGLQLGALSPLLLAGAVLVWRWRERPIAGGLLAAAVVTAKLFLAPLVVGLILGRRYRTAAWALGATGLLLSLGFLLGPLGPGAYLHLLAELGRHEARQGFGPIGALMNLGLASGVAQAVVAGTVALLIVGVARRPRARRDERLLFSAPLLAALALSPVVWSHYLVLLAAIPIIYQAPRRWFLSLAIGSWAIAPPHGLHLHTTLLGVTALGSWLAVAGAAAVFGLVGRVGPRTSRS